MDNFFNKMALKYSTHNENFNMFNTFKGPLYKTNKKLYSQNGEDGILYYIFSCIGYTNKKCIEIIHAVAIPAYRKILKKSDLKSTIN